MAAAERFLFLAGFVDGALVLLTAMEFARRRGWVVESPARRRVLTGAMLLSAASTVTHWPPGVWGTGLFVAWGLVSLACLFWPARRGASHPQRSVTA